MPMKPYPVHCSGKSCGNLALYKIASRWSHGVTEELKTYALSCEDCLPALYRDAVRRKGECRLTIDEKIDAPSVFELVTGVVSTLPTPLEPHFLADTTAEK